MSSAKHDNYELCSFSKLSVTSPTSQLILQPFYCFTYVTTHSPSLLLLHLCHSLSTNLSFASPTSEALHLLHLASRTWIIHRQKFKNFCSFLIYTFYHSINFENYDLRFVIRYYFSLVHKQSM